MGFNIFGSFNAVADKIRDALASLTGDNRLSATSLRDLTWANMDKSISNINDIMDKSHTSLSDIGTKTHSQIDTHINDDTIHFTESSIDMSADDVSFSPAYADGSQNTSTTDLMPTMTSNNTPSPYVISASSTYSGRNPYEAFSNSYTEGNDWGGTSLPAVIAVDFGNGNAKIVNKMRWRSRDYNSRCSPRDWTIEGSNADSPVIDNDSYWTVLDTRTDQSDPGRATWTGYYTWTNSVAYRHIRMKITDRNVIGGTAVYLSIAEIELIEAMDPHEFINADNVEDALIDLDASIMVGPHVRSIVEGRIDLSSATQLKWTPVSGIGISLYNGSNWEVVSPSSDVTFANTAVDLDDNALVVDAVYDLFASYSSKTSFSIVAKKWTNTTTRWGTLYTHQGVLVHENSTNGLKRRFLGTIYTYNNSSTVNFKDENNYRYISNYYNTKLKQVISQNNTSGTWTYASTTTRESNGGTNQIRGRFVLCTSQEGIVYGKWMITSSSSGAAMTGCGFNSTTSKTGSWAWLHSGNTQVHVPLYAPLSISAGYNYITTVEKSDAGTATFESSSGAQGAIYLQIAA